MQVQVELSVDQHWELGKRSIRQQKLRDSQRKQVSREEWHRWTRSSSFLPMCYARVPGYPHKFLCLEYFESAPVSCIWVFLRFLHTRLLSAKQDWERHNLPSRRSNGLPWVHQGWIHFGPTFRWKWRVFVAQLYPTLCDPMDCSPPGSSVHGIPQARVLEWVAIPFSKGSFQLWDTTWVLWIAIWFLYRLSHLRSPGEKCKHLPASWLT